MGKLIKQLTIDNPKKEAELAAELDVSAAQMKNWLKRLVENKSLVKTKRPVRFVWNE